ncbi:TPA: HNH endonuclease, partial [Klebsiella pneumoniae]|nr:HNH endonuclease [Klebsiella pneumoniae]
MFNVVRPLQAPESLASQRTYKSEDVIVALRAMFYNKCYLCEQDSLADPEVEHFIPHENDPSLKFGWGNLYYACRRCNGIKSNTHVNLLDCTLSNNNVSDDIIHFAGNAAVGEILIKASNDNP